MIELARLALERDDGALVAHLSGEVDRTNAPDLEARLVESVPRDALGVVVDLAGVTHLDVAGVRLLFNVSERLQGKELHLAVPEEAPVRRVLALTKLDLLVPLHETVEAALAAIRARR